MECVVVCVPFFVVVIVVSRAVPIYRAIVSVYVSIFDVFIFITVDHLIISNSVDKNFIGITLNERDVVRIR